MGECVCVYGFVPFINYTWMTVDMQGEHVCMDFSECVLDEMRFGLNLNVNCFMAPIHIESISNQVRSVCLLAVRQ